MKNFLAKIRWKFSSEKEKTLPSFRKTERSVFSLKPLITLRFVVRPEEFESPTCRLGGGCSILLSYERVYSFVELTPTA